MARVDRVTSSGFVIERPGGEELLVIRGPRRLVPLAELEYLREVGPRGGRITSVRRTTGDGRELHLIEVTAPDGAASVYTFDAGPALLGHVRRLTEGIGLIVYGLAGATAVGTLGYLVVRFVVHGGM
jgi:hypothetical protein